MDRRRFLLAAGGAATAGLAGCISSVSEPSGRPAGADVHVEDDKTEMDVDSGTAQWTWSGDINPPRSGEPCDVRVTVAVYDAEGTELDAKTTTLRDVGSDHQMRSVSLFLDPEEADRISTYEVTVEDSRC